MFEKHGKTVCAAMVGLYIGTCVPIIIYFHVHLKWEAREINPLFDYNKSSINVQSTS